MIDYFVTRPVAALLAVLGLLVFGIAAWTLLPIAALPEVDYPTIEVDVSWPGASPEVMASNVASPLEQQLIYTQGIRQLTSVNTQGNTEIRVELSLETDINAAYAEVQHNIDAAAGDLPADLPNPPGAYKGNPSDWSVLYVALSSDTLPLAEVGRYTDTLVLRRASLIPGVRRGQIQQNIRSAIRVRVNPTALAGRQLSLEDVRQALLQASQNRPKGSLDNGVATAQVDSNDQLKDVEEFRDLVVAFRNNAAVHLSDVATVEEGPEDEVQRSWMNGRPAHVIGFKKTAGANVVRTVDGIRAALPGVTAALPPGIKLEVFSDRAGLIRSAVGEVEFTLLLTTGLVVLVIFIFLRNLAATVIPGITIPLSILGTFMVLFACRYSLDNLSLMALIVAVGFVVDDAVVVIENVSRHVEAGEAPLTATIRGTKQVAFTIVSMTASLVAVFIPVLFMGGMVGRLFREFGVAVSAAILISALISLTLTPAMCARFIRPHRPGRQNAVVRACEAAVTGMTNGYTRSLAWSLRHAKPMLALFVGTMLVTGWLFHAIPKGFFPQQDNGQIDVTLDAPPDTSAETMIAVSRQIDAVLRADPAVATVWTGLFSTKDGNSWVVLKPAAERPSTLEVAARLRKATASVSGIKTYVRAQQELVIGATPTSGDYIYQITDPSATELDQWVPVLTDALKKLPQLRDVASDAAKRIPTVKLVVDRPTAARLGVHIQAIDNTLYDAFGQRKVLEIYGDSLQSYVIMQADPNFRLDERALETLYVASDTGTLVPLSTVSHIETGTAPLVIYHRAQLPSAVVNFSTAPGVALGDAVEAIHRMENRVGKPPGLQTSFDGNAGEFERSLASQPWLIGAAILVVYIVLGILYQSLVHPLTILSSLPSAGLGALVMLMLTGYDLSVIAVIGIILLIGIVKKNAIMMVDFALQAEREGAAPEAAIFDAARVRFRPIMMTTFAALIGALPLALGSGAGFELRRPLGIAIVGGLLISQFLTLYTTPIVHLTLARLARRLPGTVRQHPFPPAALPHPGED
ncbi:MAG TPA: efflux RND transporter permease subunit [Aliidongia sp.]|uniref:efflux RND transporter permease subunit n=1 Tax=Aliidongia sp. TaxID=1914230 RepID=UPI002DDD9C99|nr:efflux RND transporter permease subunit [Aliidongia sp.]HEV2676670.1 efflux RND transporter permease subunit [Aliidongia sp.]